MTRRFLNSALSFQILAQSLLPSECPLKGLLFSFKVLFFGAENASICVILGLSTAVLATGKAITARRMFGRVSIRYATILEREESRSAAQTRASQYALSLTETVMFLMGSPFGNITVSVS